MAEKQTQGETINKYQPDENSGLAKSVAKVGVTSSEGFLVLLFCS